MPDTISPLNSALDPQSVTHTPRDGMHDSRHPHPASCCARHGQEETSCACHTAIKVTQDSDCAEDGAGFSWIWRVIIPGLFFLAGLLGKHWLNSHFGAVPVYALMLAAYLLCGLPVLREAGRSIVKGDFFNEFTLMSLATLVAIGIGDLAEAVGVMLFYSIGEAVQDLASGKSRRSIRSLIASKPQTATVKNGDQVCQMRPEEVPVGSTVLVKPGDKVPLDGDILSGSANLDMSSLTGESAPVKVAAGGKAYSGAICLDGDLVVKTTAIAADSMTGKILSMVEHAVSMKSKTERFITTFARYYTPAVVGAAALVLLIPPLFFHQPWNVWIYRALVLLVVSCPCALLLSVPLAFFAGIGMASRHGMLVKGGQVFDALAKVKTVIFDKTGTLTEGKLSLSHSEPAPGVDAKELLRLAALAETRSNHPLAKAILAAAGEAGKFQDNLHIADVAGKGIVATVQDDEILVGNAKLLRDHQVEFRETPLSDVAVYVALNGKYQGCLTFADQLKRDSVKALHELKQKFGAKLFMLTGDRKETAAAVAEKSGIDGFRADLLPDQKVSAYREISPNGDAVFVGDGVNDAPVLAVSGVGVAMGALGSAAAVEAADAVILDDSPAHLTSLFGIAARTRRVAGENIVLALTVKTVVMVLGVLGISGMWSAVFADVGVALLAVVNSLRLTRE